MPESDPLHDEIHQLAQQIAAKGTGLSEMIAASVVQYAQIAVRLSRDVTALAELRAGLRERLKQSSLMDEVGFTRAFEGQLVLACHMTSNNQ